MLRVGATARLRTDTLASRALEPQRPRWPSSGWSPPRATLLTYCLVTAQVPHRMLVLLLLQTCRAGRTCSFYGK